MMTFTSATIVIMVTLMTMTIAVMKMTKASLVMKISTIIQYKNIRHGDYSYCSLHDR